jgi:hypothetical protein
VGKSPEEIPRWGDGAQALRHRPIDLVHLAKQSMGDWALECEVLRLFDQMARTYFARVERSGTIEELIYHLQSLKGAAAGVGAWGIAELSLQVETELAGEAVDPERIEDLHIAVEEASAFIEEILRNEPA